LRPIVDVGDIATMRTAMQEVFVHEAVARWIVELVRATRELELVAIGSSVRGTLALNRAARAWAMLDGRKYVTPEDVERLFVPVLMHRLLFRPSFLAEIRDNGWEAASRDVQQRCLAQAPKPGFDIDLDVPAAAV
jgi:MoxR-like ATPase